MKNNIIVLFSILISSFSFAQEKNYNETDLSISTNSETINGTLLNPISIDKSPLILLIPGSGPTDRDGNNSMMKNNSLKFLAEDLIKKNIATYRYDKSVLSFTKDDKEKIDSLTINVFINEAKAVISYFKKENNYSKIIVAGHSQGSLVGMIAANNTVDGFISLAGAGRTIDSILVEQIEKQAPFLKEDTEKILAELIKGNTVDDFNPMLNSLFNKSVQPFLISWIKFNPQEELKKLTIPILLINGLKDIQVSTIEAELLHKANKDSQLYLVENMNHLFKEIKGDINENMGSYNNPNLPVMEELTNIITTFVNGIK
ncbi:MAG: alpha/beta hydrolase [Lutibacter sp.]|nr:alpha/beta hydrolase [Lutibacter sp.]